MKKVVSLALSALLALSLAACSSSNTPSTAASSAATSDAASSEESTSDSSTSTASSAADNATAEPDIQFDESFQPQTIADNIPVPSSCRALAMMMTTDTTGRLTSRTKRMTKLFALSQAARP